MYKILFVEDDTLLLDMYTTKFSEGGYEIVAVKKVETALNRLREGEIFDAILFDIVMPGLTGMDLLSAVIKESLGGNPACIALSNQGEQADIDAAKKAGAVGYIVKAQLIPSEVVAKVGEIIKSNAPK